eukprot:962221-Rhodomonas_salina.1
MCSSTGNAKRDSQRLNTSSGWALPEGSFAKSTICPTSHDDPLEFYAVLADSILLPVYHTAKRRPAEKLYAIQLLHIRKFIVGTAPISEQLILHSVSSRSPHCIRAARSIRSFTGTRVQASGPGYDDACTRVPLMLVGQ